MSKRAVCVPHNLCYHPVRCLKSRLPRVPDSSGFRHSATGRWNADPILYIFGGLPGSGKSTLARLLAVHLHAVHLRIDTIEHALREAGGRVSGPVGYGVAYAVAGDNLRVGLSVVADSVNPWGLTRTAWRNVALTAGAAFVEVEVMCSDPEEHRRRVETRETDIPAFRLPTWDEVVNRDYHPWEAEHIRVDTARQSADQSFAALLYALNHR
jgi:predicted kinase